jgi:hypothetical protein
MAISFLSNIPDSPLMSAVESALLDASHEMRLLLERLPSCKACNHSAERHAAERTIKMEDKISLQTELAKCRECDCQGYLVEVPNPLIGVKIEGFM